MQGVVFRLPPPITSMLERTIVGYEQAGASAAESAGNFFFDLYLAHPILWNTSKYLNNVVEQDHRRLKQRIGPMLGFKRFDTATITVSGIELAEEIKKAQFRIGKLPISFATAPVVWAALLTS